MAWQLAPDSEQLPPAHQSPGELAAAPTPAAVDMDGCNTVVPPKPELQHKESFRADGTPAAPRKETYKVRRGVDSSF